MKVTKKYVNIANVFHIHRTDIIMNFFSTVQKCNSHLVVYWSLLFRYVHDQLFKYY